MAKKSARQAGTKTSSQQTTIEFLKPNGNFSFISSGSVREGVFPPTVFSDAVYSNGIRVFPTSVKVNDSSVVLKYNDSYTTPVTPATRKQLNFSWNETYPYTSQSVPVLDPQDGQLWQHRQASRMAAKRHFPLQVFRLLGVITREVTDTDDSPLGPFTDLPKYSGEASYMGNANVTKSSKMSTKTAMTEAKAEGIDGENELEARAAEIQQQWNEKVDQGMVRKGWDRHGQIPCEAANDDKYIPLPLVRDWLRKRNVEDSTPSHTSLYNGIRSIPNDLQTIVASLLELSNPEELYNTPLILPYAVMDIVEETTAAKEQKSTSNGPVAKKQKTISTNRNWKIRIGVYANRLLPEVMTCHDLHIIMTALDDGSFRITETLHLPPVPNEPVFESAPTPVVIMKEPEHEQGVSDSDDEEKKSDDVMDATIEESTRDESRISAFTTTGFLKLLENTGNDISNWPMIEAKIAPLLKLNLMLHQQHAICWMLQMESLGGFGINSILWEEREFLDGGQYYYSPALGQIRLSPPPVMKGGLLCDEQGLGKTLEVVGLIAATLDELKREAAKARKERHYAGLTPTHATLIIVPPALVSQWRAEIRKAVGDALVVHYFNPKSLDFESDETEKNDPDIVITTYAALQAKKSSKTLSGFEWGRVVLDEMQEVRSSTSKIAKNCDYLMCDRRWMVSGTPLFEGIDDLRGELNFLRLEPYAAGLEDGFFDLSITNHWVHRSLHGLETLRILGNLILRRSKSMSIVKTRDPLLGLPPLTVEFIPVHQDSAERAVYCFLESVVSRVLNGDHGEETVASRAHCLHVLREMCISAILLTGGMGACSQLKSLHGWMQGENRRQLTLKASSASTSPVTSGLSFPFSCHASIFSCDEAIQYLSSAHEDANVGDDFVTSQTLGFGGGGTNRNRSAEDFETQLKEAEENVDAATHALNSAKSKKAKALWHLALENITTGQLDFVETTRAARSFVFIWKIRSALISSCDRGLGRVEILPSLLLRGWRPSVAFIESELLQKRPSFAWAHPRAFQLDQIPSSVSGSEVKSSILTMLQSNEGSELEAHAARDNRVSVVVGANLSGETWNATLQFADEEDSKLFYQSASSANGIALPSESIVPQVQAVVDVTKANLDMASAEYKVLPSTSTQRKLSIAKKEHDRALKGLRIVVRGYGYPCHLCATRALGPTRLMEPHLALDLRQTTLNTLKQCNRTIAQKSTCLEVAVECAEKLRKFLSRQVPSDIQALTVFETLDALSKNETRKTKCPICLCNLGVAVDSHGEEQSSLVAMTHCGHVFCADCLKDYANKREGRTQNMCCPSCRRGIDRRLPVILIDKEKTEDQDALEERRQEAKLFVQKVAQLLDESNGQLDSQIWHELYLSMDLPPYADCSRHPRFNAIPGDFLAHLRAATKIALDSRPQEMPDPGKGADAGLSSKVRALLADLPLGERSVVFSESKSAVKHLTLVLEQAGIGCRALFSSQAISDAETALQDWKSTMLDPLGNEFIPFPVLIVQAGAAASGLTLTAASKMFLLEPFTRMEEERQAYARCHRYGQEKPVQIKCYFAPLSVESRLLEWRKRASAGNVTTDTKIVYSHGAEDLDMDDQEKPFNENEAEQNRTNFLLGLAGDEDDGM